MSFLCTELNFLESMLCLLWRVLKTLCDMDPRQTMLVNPDSKIASLVLADGRLLVAFNDQQARNERAARGGNAVYLKPESCVHAF